MSGVSLVALPNRFFEARRDPDIDNIRDQPCKFVNFFLRCKAIHAEGEAAPEERPFLEIVKSSLLLLKREMCSYHYIKFICNCPELLPKMGEVFSREIKKFEDHLTYHPERDQMFWRAKKMADWRRATPLIDTFFSIPLDYSYLSSDGQTVVVHRFNWALDMDTLRPVFVENIVQPDPSNLSASLLKAMDQFVMHRTLPPLSHEDLLKLHTKADQIKFQRLKEKTNHLLKDYTAEEGIFDFLPRALQIRNPGLIQACLRFINSPMRGIYLEWAPENGLKGKIRNLSPYTQKILDCTSSWITHLSFKNQALMTQLLNERTFGEGVILAVGEDLSSDE